MSGKRSSFVCAVVVAVKVVKRKIGRKTRIDTSLLSKGPLLLETASQLICAKRAGCSGGFTLVMWIRFQINKDLPLDRAFFRGIDLRQFVLAVEKSPHVVHQKRLRFRIRDVKTIVINDSSLCL